MYHSWIYIHVINTPWMMWSIVSITFAFNILMPVIIWYTFASRKPKLPFLHKLKKGKSS